MASVPTDAELTGRDIVVVGASAGGVEALTRLVARLPGDFAASVLIVLHVPARGSVLPEILSRAGLYPASHARAGDRIEPGRIYVAPPDFHLEVDTSQLSVVRGPKENGHRPAIDPLFRTAAQRFGRRVVGVILSGSLDDGTLGLAHVKSAGGLTVVQDPEEALYQGMPRSAIEHVGPAHVLPIDGIANLLGRLRSPPPSGGDDESEREEEMESDTTQQEPAEVTAANEGDGHVSRFTCPECSGTLWELREGELVKLRCRVGHSYTEESFLSEQAHALEAALWTAATALEEKADFCSRLSRRLGDAGQEMSARRYADQAENALQQSARVRAALADLVAPPPLEEERAAS